MFEVLFKTKPMTIPSPEEALPGRSQQMPVAEHHFVNGRPLRGPYPAGSEMIYIGLGCFSCPIGTGVAAAS